MKSFIILLIVVVVAATTATYGRYQSFNPCDWMEQDMAAQSTLPKLVVQGQIRAYFLVRGLVTPGPYDCLQAWWELRRDGAIAIEQPGRKL